MSAPELQKEARAISFPGPWWKHVSDAIRGVPHDYTEGSIGRSLLLLAIPMVLETLMSRLSAVVDVFFVGKLGADAVATVGLTDVDDFFNIDGSEWALESFLRGHEPQGQQRAG